MRKTAKKKLILPSLLLIFGVFILIVAISFFAVYFSVCIDENKLVAERSKLYLFDNEGKEIESEYLNRYVKYDKISSHIVNAFVALEDKRFFSHEGVDYYRTIGAMVNNVKNGYSKEGGSTITQQLAKNTQLSNEKTIIRKIKELRLAKQIEDNYKKEDILELYLNAIYYGNGIYGIDAACKKYFNKEPKDISCPEAAILAGIVKNPAKYSPIDHPENAESRMKLVLRLMYSQGYLSLDEYIASLSYHYVNTGEDDNSSYLSAVLHEAADILGISESEILNSSYYIETYYDEKVQKSLENLIKSKQYDFVTKDGSNGNAYCLVADNESGGVIAYYAKGKTTLFDRRQPGSTIKPLAVYTNAFENGFITPADVVYDESIEIDGYSPKNFGNTYLGAIDVQTAVMQSVNTVAVKLFSQLNMDECISKMERSGLTIDESDRTLSLSLGGMTYGVTGMELSEAYMTLANGGVHANIGLIKRIVNGNGTVVYERIKAENRVFSAESAYVMTETLEQTARAGTAKKLSSLPFSVAAKTGTVGNKDGNSDAWCVSYTPEFTICARFGGEDNTPEQSCDITGGGLPAMLIASLYKSIDIKKKYFQQPENVVYAEIDTYARENDGEILLANDDTPKKYRKEYCFIEKYAPKEYSPYFTNHEELFIDYGNENVAIEFLTEYPYAYRVERIDNFSGKREDIAYILPDMERMFTSASIKDTPEKGHLVRYKIEIIFNGCVVGTKISEPIIVNE